MPARPVLGYRNIKGQRRPAEAAPQFASMSRDLWVPCVLIFASIGTLLYSALHGRMSLRDSVLFVLCYSGLKLVIMAVSLPIMTRFAGVSFGMTGAALLKLAAVALAPDAAVVGYIELLPEDVWSNCFTVPFIPVVPIAAAALLFRFLLELDWDETVWCTAIVFFMTFAPMALWFKLYAAAWSFGQ